MAPLTAFVRDAALTLSPCAISATMLNGSSSSSRPAGCQLNRCRASTTAPGPVNWRWALPRHRPTLPRRPPSHYTASGCTRHGKLEVDTPPPPAAVSPHARPVSRHCRSAAARTLHRRHMSCSYSHGHCDALLPCVFDGFDHIADHDFEPATQPLVPPFGGERESVPLSGAGALVTTTSATSCSKYYPPPPGPNAPPTSHRDAWSAAITLTDSPPSPRLLTAVWCAMNVTASSFESINRQPPVPAKPPSPLSCSPCCPMRH